MSKTELAQLYMPDQTEAQARFILARWIEASPGLAERLAKTGYTKRQKIFTPIQVQLIVEAIGEP